MELVWHESQKLAFKHLVDALSSPSTLVHFYETADFFIKLTPATQDWAVGRRFNTKKGRGGKSCQLP
jgi:hypothetical protein